jgi:hypothetical protein
MIYGVIYADEYASTNYIKVLNIFDFKAGNDRFTQ